MANRLEPMNASQHHSKVKVAIELGSRTYVAGQDIAGKISVETRAEAALGISVIQVELIAVQELSSRDHHATSTFLHSRRMFQGPGLPPSNAVEALPRPGDPVQMPQGYWPARRGTTTFFFRFPVPLSAPSSINFGNGLAKVTYRLKATVGVFWKGEKRYVTDLKDAELVECALPPAAPEGTVVVGEGGKIWMQGTIVGGVGISGHPSCVELSVKNHTSKKASGLTLSLIRKLHLPAASLPGGKGAPFQLSDTLLTVPFRGPEYTVLPGGEGVANLVFDIPRWARGVRGGPRQSVEGEVLPADGAISELSSGKLTDALFEVRCLVQIKLSTGIGSKDLVLDLPINIMHPAAVPEPPAGTDPFPGVFPPLEAPRPPFMGGAADPHSGQSSPILYGSPGAHAYAALPPPGSPIFAPQPVMSPQLQPQWTPSGQPYYYPPPPEVWSAPAPPARPLSAGGSYPMPPMPIQHMANVAPPHPGLPSGRPLPVPVPMSPPSGLPASASAQRNVPAWVMGMQSAAAADAQQQSSAPAQVQPGAVPAVGSEEGKGERASRIAQKLHQSRRDRSASPTSRRFVHSRRASRPTAIAMPPPQTQAQIQIEPPLLSPRPMLSPKASYANIPGSAQGTQGTVKLSDVRQLERMAEDEVRQEEEEQAKGTIGLTGMMVAGPGGFPQLDSPPKAVDKTLPGPPVPSGKSRVAPPSSVPRATDIFGVGLGAPQPHVSDDLPRGATLTIPKRSSGFVRPNGGLEALEKRLLADVGTTKVQARVAVAETESIVRALGSHAEEPESELSVAELLQLSGGLDRALDKRRLSRDAPRPEVKEAQAERPSVQAAELTAVRPHGSDVPLVPPMTASQERKMREQEDPGRKEEERKREEEAARLRRAAKGRIANWLGAVSPEPVPEPVIEEQETVRAHRRASAEVDRDRTRRISQPPEVKEFRNLGVADASPKANDDAHRTRRASLPPPVTPERPVAAAKAEERLTPAKSSDDVNRTRRISLPPPTVGVVKDEGPAAAPTPGPKPRPSSMVHSRSQPNIPQTSPAPKPEVRNPLKALESAPAITPFAARAEKTGLELPQPKVYDVRSARGGRGGKVTAVAAIFANAANANEPKSPPLRSPPPLKSPPLKSPTSPALKPNRFDFPPAKTDAPTPGPVPKADIVASKPKVLTPALGLPRSTTAPAFSSGPTSPRLAPSPTPRAVPPPIAPKPAPPPVAPKPASLSSDKLPTSPQLSKPSTAAPRSVKPSPVTNAPARMIKSTSVPAIISASVAKPTLSSTASLARPMTSAAAARLPTSPRMAPTVSELPELKKPTAAAALRNLQQQDKQDSGPSAAPKPELQFGKARLKELIQKYQDGR